MPILPKGREKKDQQVNVRFCPTDLEALDDVGRIEDRDRAYLISFFTMWGVQQYRRVGSLTALRYTDIPKVMRSTEQLAGEAKVRLQLRKSAQGAVNEKEAKGSQRTHEKKSDRV